LLHIPTRRLLPATPRLFILNGLEFDYESKAPSPENWLKFLDQLWPKDTESIQTLQEWIGYLLTALTFLQKLLLIIGPKRRATRPHRRTHALHFRRRSADDSAQVPPRLERVPPDALRDPDQRAPEDRGRLRDARLPLHHPGAD